jgi:hypothetical protein
MAWVLGAFLICPCHLPITLGLASLAFSGTVVGLMLRNHPYLGGAIITGAWLAATARGFYYFMLTGRSSSVGF